MKELIITMLSLFYCVGIISCNVEEKAEPPHIKTENTAESSFIQPSYPWSFPVANNKSRPVAQYVRRILQDSRGHLWFGTNSRGIIRYDGDTLIYLSPEEGLIGRQVTGILEDKGGNIWITTKNGISKHDGKTFINFSEKDGLDNIRVLSIYQDRQNVIWAGTSKGVYKYNPEAGAKFVEFKITQGNISNSQPAFSSLMVSSILEDKNGIMWFGTEGMGVFTYDPLAEKAGKKTITQLTTKDGLCDNNIVCILEDREGNIWFSSRFGGLSRYNPAAATDSNNGFTNFNVDNVDIGNNEVWTMYEDRAGNIWFSSEGYGLYRFKDHQLYRFGKDEGFPMAAVQSIFEDKGGILWIGGGNGLYSYDGKRFREITSDFFRKGC